MSSTTRLSHSLINPMSRSLVYSCSVNKHLTSPKHPSNCTCCASFASNAKVHTNADKDLSVFLDKEIGLEQNMMKAPQGALRIPGFDVSEDGSNLTLHRKFQDEEITVRLNVNASVEPDEMQGQFDETNPDANSIGEMKSMPDFSIEVTKPNGKTLVMNCSFYRGPPEDIEDAEGQQQQDKGDAFQIENFFLMNKGEKLSDKNLRDNIYMGDGEIIDGQMYDLLMNYLDERGIGNEFAENVTAYCTHYEHKQYINLLSNLKSFISE
ncbi:complement component 1 Q subcomponent-binding protein-like protein [Leptotrombidium deliense]|uniref:Complement component 1 Q subcomponent-binding protein-like protein n=1 Tax=Leptotrombidium deliense TaxID=299467 RepID=A0A443SQR7_9ACAR|nr:complement component 1 Q subcomponent-binding protein-like protein [Leptotrombidium deliense]